MPNRVLRDWTDSETIDRLNTNSERFFVRLIMKVDDFGRYTSNIKMLKSTLFPLKSDIRETDISLWLTECEQCGLIALYNVAGKDYLQINNFNQQIRQKKEKYPAPKTCNANDEHVNSTCSPERKPNQSETETNPKQKAKKPTPEILILEPDEIKRRLIEDEFQIREFVCKSYAFTEDQYEKSVLLFVSEKTTVLNELDKDYPEVLKQYTAWVKYHREKLLKQFNGKQNGDTKSTVGQPWRQQFSG